MASYTRRQGRYGARCRRSFWEASAVFINLKPINRTATRAVVVASPKPPPPPRGEEAAS